MRRVCSRPLLGVIIPGPRRIVDRICPSLGLLAQQAKDLEGRLLLVGAVRFVDATVSFIFSVLQSENDLTSQLGFLRLKVAAKLR